MDFDKLPKEAEDYLSYLVGVEESDGEDAVADILEDHHGDYFAGTGDAREAESHNRSIRHLAEVGMIDCQIEPGCCTYGGLTAKGRSYFDDKAEAERSWRSEHRHDYRVAAFGAVTGGILGLFGGAFSSQIIAWVTTILP